MMDTMSKVRAMMDRRFEKAHIHPDLAFYYDQVVCMTSLVKETDYMGIISATVGDTPVGCSDLVALPFEEPIRFPIGFIQKKNRRLPKIGREMIRYIQNLQSEESLL